MDFAAKVTFTVAFTIILAVPNAATAKTIILQSPGAATVDYQAFVLSSGAYQYPSEFELLRIPSPAGRKRLADLFSRAQLSYTGRSLATAESNFRAVVDMAKRDHWLPEDQSIFLYSFLRLAQLSHDSAETDRWLQEAIRFAPDAHPDPDLFPPPLVEHFQQVRATFARKKIAVERFKNDFHFLLLNGKRVNLENEAEEIEIPEGTVRLTLLSDIYQNVTIETSADKIANFIPPRQARVSGSCEKPVIQWSGGGDVKPFFGKDCAVAKLEDIPKPEIAHVAPGTAPSLADPIPPPPKPFYEKTWFWVGVGVAVVTGFIIAEAGQSKSRTQPVESNGF